MFGAFQVESCDELNCFEEIIYEFDISNVGTNFMNITRVEVTTNGVTVSFLEQVKVNPLALVRRRPSRKIGPSASSAKKLIIWLSLTLTLTPDGGTCFANDTYRFDINPLCSVNAELVHSGWNQR
jgi:hypothetical protein